MGGRYITYYHLRVIRSNGVHCPTPNCDDEMDFEVSVLPLQTTGATDWEFFRVHNEFFLVVANAYNYGPQAAELAERYKTNSTIYRLNKQRKQFEKYQDIVTYSYGMRVVDLDK